MRHVIIGNSAAGVFAAEAIRDIDSECGITIISDEDSTCYSRCLLPYCITGELSREQLVIRDLKWYRERAVETLLGKRAIAVAEGDRRVILDDEDRIAYDSLLIATGSSSHFPEIEGIDKPMVFGLRNLEDAVSISEVLPEVERAVVLGGGLVGLKSAYALWKQGVRVTVVEMLGHILPQMLDLPAAEIVEKTLRKKDIGVRTKCSAAEIVARGDRIESVRLDDGETIRCDLVVCAVGVRPNTELAVGTGIETNEGILVDEYMRTNLPGVYAAGDVAETTDFLSKKRGINATWPSAAREGRVAGSNMAGVRKRCDSELSMNSLDFFDIPIVSMGLVNEKGEEYETMTACSPEENVYKKLVLKDGKIVGMLFVGDVEKAGVILSCMKTEGDISLLKSAFLKGEVLPHSPAMKAFGQVVHYPDMG